MIGVVVGVDQVAEWFIGDFPDGSDGILRMNRARRGTFRLLPLRSIEEACPRRRHLISYEVMPSKREAVPPSIATRSASLKPGVLSMWSTAVFVHGNG